jgi:acyl-CoA synthetase (NDP forming)
MTKNGSFGEGFPPRSVGIVGVSRNEDTRAPGYSGLKLFRSLRTSGFPGSVYAVNPRAAEIDGIATYPDLMSVPGPLDLAVIAVPAHRVPAVLEDCITAKVRNVQICTSGFGETGTGEGRALDTTLREIIGRGNLRVIGPNCMGFHVPSLNYRMFEELDLVQGPVALLSQSGGHARTFLLHSPGFGIGCSKAVSFGNAITMEASDFLEYLEDDPETEIICMYMEGPRDGKRLLDLVRRVNPEKPVIVWKAGLTESGARASASHTGSMKGDRQLWEAFFRQTGAVRVNSLDEMMDAGMSFLQLPPADSARAAVLGIGGGATVAYGDICGREGIETPPLSGKTLQGMSEFISLVNQGMANPMDVPVALSNPVAMPRALELLTEDPGVDVIILSVSVEFLAGGWGHYMDTFKKALCGFLESYTGGKPVVLAVEADNYFCDAERCIREMREAGVTVYPSLARACRALRRFAAYHRFLAVRP